MANEILMASPVSALLQGRQAAQQNQLGQMQIQQAQQAQQRDTQFRQALPAYLTGGTNALAALYSADPERAMQAQNFMTQQNALAKSQQIEQAKVAHAQATGVLASASPARYMRVLLPKIAAQWSQQNGKAPDEMTDEDARSLANEVATQAGAAAGLEPKLEEKDLGDRIAVIDPLTGRTVREIPKSATPGEKLAAATQMRGQDVSAATARASAGQTASTQKQNTAGKLRDDYSQTVKNTGWFDQQGFYQRLKTVADDKTGASDLALVFSYMKVLDPTSAVREGEYANAQNTAGIPGKIIAQYNKVLDGSFLSSTQRSEFKKSADKIYSEAYKRQESIKTDFTKKAQRAEIDPQDVLIDYGAPKPISSTEQSAAPTATGPNGKRLILRDGKWVPM